MSTATLTQLLGIDLPVIQAPMAGVQVSAMAIAVSEAGGLGSLPAAMLGDDALRKELTAIRAATTKSFNVNFFAHQSPVPDEAREAGWRGALRPYYAEFGADEADIPQGPGRRPFSAEVADVIEAFRPPVISFHFGLPDEALLARVRSWGAKVISSAIAQGLEAGGHRGLFLSDDVGTQVGLFALLPQIVRAVRVPVIAAGGIADAAGVAAARALGASGVQVGTAYMLCPEATTSALHRTALRSKGAAQTALTNLFTGRPARGIVNRAMRELGPISAVAPAFPLATAAIAPLRAKAEAAGSSDFSPLWAGQNVSACREVPAAQITRDLAAGWVASPANAGS